MTQLAFYCSWGLFMRFSDYAQVTSMLLEVWMARDVGSVLAILLHTIVKITFKL